MFHNFTHHYMRIMRTYMPRFSQSVVLWVVTDRANMSYSSSLVVCARPWLLGLSFACRHCRPLSFTTCSVCTPASSLDIHCWSAHSLDAIVRRKRTLYTKTSCLNEVSLAPLSACGKPESSRSPQLSRNLLFMTWIRPVLLSELWNE